MPPDKRSSPTTSDVAFAADLALARMRLAVGSAVEDTHETRAVHAAIREARGRSAGRDTEIAEASQRLISASRELLRRLDRENGQAYG